MPLAGVVGRAEMMDAPHAGGLGGTYGGNPVACAAALGAIATMEELDLNAAHGRSSRPWPPGFGRWPTRSPRSGTSADAEPCSRSSWCNPAPPSPTPQLAGKISAGCHQAGVLTLTCGTYGNVLRFLPSLVMPEHLLEEALDVIEEVALREA